MAVLFDIDGTLLHARGAGRPAFAAAIERTFGAPYPDIADVSFVGATDAGVIHRIAGEMGIAPTTAQIERFYLTLAVYLDDALSRLTPEVFPGVREVLRRLSDRGACLGLMTGNIRATAWCKVHYAGLDSFFSFGAYGDVEPARVAMVRRAIAEAERMGSPARLIVGDAPADVAAAREVGLPILAVCTGWVDADALRAAGADAVIENLADAEAALRVMEELAGKDALYA